MSEELNIDNIDFDSNDKDIKSVSKQSSIKSVSKQSQKSSNLSCQSKSVKKKIRCPKEDAYFWESIDVDWQTKLGSDKFMVKNCLGDGNCQFRSIESALTNAGYKTTHERLRKRLAKYIMSMEPKMFIEMIKSYQIEMKQGEFVGGWNPMEIRNKRDFIKVVKSPGFGFQGDFITLQLISKAIGIDIIIFNNSAEKNIINLSNPKALQEKIIILYYTKDDQSHYQTVGLKGNGVSIKTIFARSKLSDEITRILDKRILMSFHITDICKSGVCGKSSFQLNYILNVLQARLGVKELSKQDRLAVMKMIQVFI